MTTSPYFSVVIPTFNRIDTLSNVLDALVVQHGAPAFEVIVVDDGSKDSTAAMMGARAKARKDPYLLTFRSQKNSGPGAARNLGVTLAAGQFVVFIGDDTVPEENFLREHFAVHEKTGHDPLVACLGYTGWPDGERVTSFMHYINDYGLQFGYKLIEDGAVVPFNFFYTSNISLSRALMLEFPFDTTFPSAAWEDIELAFRLDARGLAIHYNAAAVTRHYHPMTVDSFARRQFTVGKSGAIFYSKHPELGHFLGVHELAERGLATERQLSWLRRTARLGERFGLLARHDTFERLMRQHYLRGLQAGLDELKNEARPSA